VKRVKLFFFEAKRVKLHVLKRAVVGIPEFLGPFSGGGVWWKKRAQPEFYLARSEISSGRCAWKAEQPVRSSVRPTRRVARAAADGPARARGACCGGTRGRASLTV